MTEYDLNQMTSTTLDNDVKPYSVDAKQTDGVNASGETTWENTNWTKWYGYYKSIPEFKTAINGYSTWVVGKGWTAGDTDTAVLENMTGWGEDTFMSILWNMLVTKKVAGDAYAEIIRTGDNGALLNIKVLDPGSITIVVDDKGILKEYKQRSKTKDAKPKTFQPENILHLCNDRVADNIHGTSITEAVEWVIDARNEAMTDWRKVLHRNLWPIRIIEVDTDDTTKRNKLKTEWSTAIKNGEVLIVPKGTVAAKESGVTLQNPIEWIRYLENFFYQALGVPKVILGGSEEFTEASSKIGYLTFEQIYTKEVEELKADLWNQLAIRVEFNKPASIKNELLQSEDKNTSTEGFQPSETEPSITRSE